MQLKGSCYCGKISFVAETKYRCPILWCYCSKCRKCNGSPVSMYIECVRENVKFEKGENLVHIFEEATNKRHSCSHCGSRLFFDDSRWPDKIYPNASAIDGPLLTSKEFVHIFVPDKPDWFPIHTPGPHFDEYPEPSSGEYHHLLNIPVDEN